MTIPLLHAAVLYGNKTIRVALIVHFTKRRFSEARAVGGSWVALNNKENLRIAPRLDTWRVCDAVSTVCH